MITRDELRSHRHDEAADTIDLLLGLMHDAFRDRSTPIWAYLDRDIQRQIERNVFVLAEQKRRHREVEKLALNHVTRNVCADPPDCDAS